jgi:hypothetical protein
MKDPNPHAQALGRLGALARWKKTTPEQRSEFARELGLARSKKLPKAERSRIAALGGKASKGKPKKGRKAKEKKHEKNSKGNDLSPP